MYITNGLLFQPAANDQPPATTGRSAISFIPKDRISNRLRIIHLLHTLPVTR